jgi:hypothetical protein
VKNNDPFRILGWVIPGICIALAGWIIYHQDRVFQGAIAARNQANIELEEAVHQKVVIDSMPAERRFAAADDVPIEESSFLTYLKARAAAHGVTLASWNSQTIEYGKANQGVVQDQQLASILKGIRKVSSTLSLTGTYGSLRALIGDIEASDRLFTLSNLAWTRSKGGTSLTMVIARYVAPKKPSAAAPKAVALSQGVTGNP